MREITIVDLANQHERADRGYDALEPYPLRVMAGLWQPRTASEIKNITQVPIASVYRSIGILESVGFVKTGARPLTANAHRVSMWIRTVRSLHIRFGDGEVVLSVELRDLPTFSP